MKESQLKVFIDGIVNYFHYTGEPSVAVGSPYLIDNIQEISSDYTGTIAISGTYEGACHFTAPSALVRHLILSFGETDTSESMISDTIGEVANTLSGNARKHLGAGFNISTPKVSRGAPDDTKQSAGNRIYAIPINWKSYKAALGIHLN